MSKENRHRILLFHGTKRIKEASFLWLYQFFISCGKRFATSDRLALDATILFRNIARIHSLSINVKALQQPQFIIQTDKMSFRVKSPAWEVFYLCAFLFRKTISITVTIFTSRSFSSTRPGSTQHTMDHDWLHTHAALGPSSSHGDRVKGHWIFGRSQL